MDKPNGTSDILIKSEEAQLETTTGGDEDPLWGTWEELLLACAVNRYGTNNWDSVAVEIQRRSSPSVLQLLTPRNCRNKYLQLTRRFFTRNRRVDNKKNDADSDCGGGAGGSIITTDESVPLLEELRKLRVAELRRELERYDLSIVSLQSKVKKMKEERERSSSENGEQNSSNLCREKEEAKRDHNESELNREVNEEPDKSPLSVAGEAISNKEEVPANESISTDRRSNHDDTGSGRNTEEGAKGPDRTAGEGREEAERCAEEKPVREEDSCYGSSDSVEKEDPDPVQKGVKVEPGSVSDSPELVESVAESKEDERGGGCGGGGVQEEATTTTTTKEEFSDVQSSATKSRRDGDSDHLVRGSSDRDDLENKRKSPAVKIEIAGESQPLIDFLEDLKRHKVGSVFSRRLDSQETSNYKNFIRQHIDLQIVQKKVKEGAYSESHLKFFRDLLLLVNNAKVFFSKNSTEFLAATELRNVISNKMSQKIAKSDSTSEKQSSLQKLSLPKKETSEPSESLLLKPKLGGPLIFCRKRSSIAKATAATASSSGSDKKNEQTVSKLGEEKGFTDAKQVPEQVPAKAEEPRITKKRSRDRFSSVPPNMKKNGKNGGNSSSKQTSSEKSQGKGGGGGSSSQSQPPDPRSESKNKNSNGDVKKRSAASSFLNRMKQSSSSSNNGPLLDALKSSPLTGSNGSRGGGGGSDHKKNDNVKGSGKKEQVSSKVSESKQQAKEKGSPAKKSLGRPPKKGAAIATPPLPPPPAKRNRDGKESEPVATNNKRKRSKK